MGGWREVKAGLRIAYSNKKSSPGWMGVWVDGWKQKLFKGLLTAIKKVQSWVDGWKRKLFKGLLTAIIKDNFFCNKTKNDPTYNPTILVLMNDQLILQTKFVGLELFLGLVSKASPCLELDSRLSRTRQYRQTGSPTLIGRRPSKRNLEKKNFPIKVWIDKETFINDVTQLRDEGA